MIPKAESKAWAGRYIGWGLALGAIIWIGLLIAEAISMQNIDTGSQAVQFGPFTLNCLSKTAAGDGYSVGFSFESGLVWYCLFWIVLGLGFGYFTSQKTPNPKK